MVLRGARLRRRLANFLVFGWSKTASPTPLPSSSDAGNWCRFSQATGSVIDDYPKLATNDGHVVIGSNVFQGNSYLTARIWAYEKPPRAIRAAPAGGFYSGLLAAR